MLRGSTCRLPARDRCPRPSHFHHIHRRCLAPPHSVEAVLAHSAGSVADASRMLAVEDARAHALQPHSAEDVPAHALRAPAAADVPLRASPAPAGAGAPAHGAGHSPLPVVGGAADLRDARAACSLEQPQQRAEPRGHLRQTRGRCGPRGSPPQGEADAHRRKRGWPAGVHQPHRDRQTALRAQGAMRPPDRGLVTQAAGCARAQAPFAPSGPRGDAEDPAPAFKFRRWRAQPAAPCHSLPGCGMWAA